MILSGDSGTVYALSNDDNNIGTQQITIRSNGTIAALSSEEAGKSLWTTEKSGDNWKFKNSNRYLWYNFSSLSLNSNNSTSWTCDLSTNTMSVNGWRDNTYYVGYNSGFTVSENIHTVYFFHEVTEMIYADQIDG